VEGISERGGIGKCGAQVQIVSSSSIRMEDTAERRPASQIKSETFKLLVSLMHLQGSPRGASLS